MLFTKELADNLSILRHDAIGPLQGIREGSRTHLRATAEHGEWFNEWDGQVSRAYSELRRPISTAGDVTKVRQAARDLRPLALEYLQRLRAMNLDRKALARADRHVQQFLPMLDQIDRLDFSIAPYRAPVDLSELLRNELAARDYYDKHGRPVTVGMRLDHNAIVHANPQLITRVVDNLLQDASLHPDMDDKTPVHLRITTTRTDAGYLRLRVVSLGAQPLTDKLMAAIGH